jgi:hypothetical protein
LRVLGCAGIAVSFVAAPAPEDEGEEEEVEEEEKRLGVEKRA